MSDSPALSRTRQRLILAVLVFSPLIVWLDNTILNTAFETLASPGRGLGASPGELQWSVGSYTLVFATLMFTAGALGDRFGHRTILLAGLTVFGLASVWAAYAGGPGGLITARAVMGAGSALIVPASMAIVSFTFEGPARASAFGLFSTTAGIGLAGGPLLAGLLLAHFWWGSVFLVNVPVVLVGIAAVLAFVPDFRQPVPRRLDLAGPVLSAAGLAGLAYGLIKAGQVAEWGRTDVWMPIAAGLVLLVAFVTVELKLRQPSFDPRLLAARVFGGGNAALGLLFFAMTGTSFYNAFYLQGARGFSALSAGFATMPAAIGVMLGAPVGTRLVARFSVRPVTATGLTVAALAIGTSSLYGLHTPLAWLEIVMLIQGLAIGTVIAPVTATVLSTLPLAQAGSGSAVNNTIRQTGSVLGIAIGGSIMSIVYRHGIDGALTGAPEPVKRQARISAEQARHLNRPDLTRAADHAFIHAMHVTSLWVMGIAFTAVAVLLVALRPASAPGPQPVEPVEAAVLVE